MNISAQDMALAAELIRSGRLVAFPTETVYGLGANALDPLAVARIFQAKGRPQNHPVIVHVDSVEMARNLCAEWPRAAETLAARLWPGPLTLVVPKAPHIPSSVTAGLPSVGLRVPAHPVALQLIHQSGCAIAAPSANRFTELSPTTAEHVRRSLGDAVDLILDGGSTPVGIESTVIGLTGARPVLLRPGMISRAELETLIGPLDLAARPEDAEAHPSPGMHPRHYSPNTPLFLGKGPSTGLGVYRTVRDMGASPRHYAATLYATLHRLDQEGWDWIALELPPALPEWEGVRDRLIRAAATITGES